MSKTKNPNTPAEEHHDDDAEPVELSEEAAGLVRSLEAERDEAIASRQRALADFANFQKRSTENERRALQTGAAGLAQSILPVLDHFDLALNQNPAQVSSEQLIGGVKIVRDELAKALQAHGVQRIEPNVNDAFDPNRHEAMMRQPSDSVEPDHIVSVLQPGYAMGEKVLRPAKVAIASGREDSTDSETEST